MNARSSSPGLLQHAALFAGLVVLSFLAYGGALDAPFVSDDINAIVNNEHVRGPVNTLEIFRSYSWWGADRADSPGYRPLTTLSFAVQNAFSGLHPAAFHSANIFLHALVALSVWVLALALGNTAPAAAIASALFALMPIHSEAVIWSVGRAELLAALGFAVCVLGLLRDAQEPSPRALALAALALLLGLFAKENTITVLAAPFLIALSSQRPSPWAPLARGALTLSLAVFAYLAIRALADGPFLPADSAGNVLDNPLQTLSPLGRSGGALAVLGRYLGLVVWPAPLSIDYSFNALGISKGFVANAWTLVGASALGLGSALAWRFRATPALLLGLGLAVASYSIVSNSVVQIGTIMGERLFYLPTLGLCLAAAPALGFLVERYGKPAIATLTGIAIVWTGVNIDRTRDWGSHVTLYSQTAAAVPQSARAHMEMGAALGHANRSGEAIQAFERALRIKPDYAVAAYNMGNMLARAQRFEEAKRAFRRAVEAKPELDRAWNNLIVAHEVLGDFKGALAVGAESVRRNPERRGLRLAYAVALASRGRVDLALNQFDKILQATPDAGDALYGRGSLLERASGCRAALPDYERAAAVLADPEIQKALERCRAQLAPSR